MENENKKAGKPATVNAEFEAAVRVAEAGAVASMGEARAIVKVASLPITGKITLEKSDGKDYVRVIMDNPFPDKPLFGEKRLIFERPDKKDRWGNDKRDRDGEERGGLFEWLAQEALTTGEYKDIGVISFTGSITYRRFRGRDGDAECIHTEIENPLGEIKKSKSLWVFLKSGKDEAVFEHLAKERLLLVQAV